MGATTKIRRILHGSSAIKPTAIGHRRAGSEQAGLLSTSSARSMAARSLKVGLPFYASLKVGGVPTGLVILTALVSDLIKLDQKSNQSSSRSLKRLLKVRQWTLAAILLQVASDVIGLTSSHTVLQSLAGLSALCFSVLILPPPFPAYSTKKEHVTSPAEPPPSTGSSILTTLKEIPNSSSATLPDPKVSSLTHNPEEADLTLAAGALTSFFTIVFFLFSSIPSAGALSVEVLAGGLLTICIAALSLAFAQPQSLCQSRGLGLLIGTLFSCAILTLLGPISLIQSAYQGALILLCSLALIKDTHSSHSSSHYTQGPSHGHAHHDDHHHDGLSHISRYLLNYSKKWPLLHSILAEKDSRRIFYFMLYVLYLGRGQVEVD